jgi:hypothetical protein
MARGTWAKGIQGLERIRVLGVVMNEGGGKVNSLGARPIAPRGIRKEQCGRAVGTRGAAVSLQISKNITMQLSTAIGSCASLPSMFLRGRPESS